MTRLTFASFAAVLLASTGVPAPPLRPASDGGLELVVSDAARMARVRLNVTVGGKPLSAAWDAAFAGLLKLHDRDRDGALSRQEAARLPSAFSLRQILWGRSAPHTGRPVPWADLDTDGDEKVTERELAAYYHRQGLGGVSVALARLAAPAVLTAALLKHLDTDGDGRISAEEWKAAPGLLGKLDRNEDELIAPEELVHGVAYPGTSGANLLTGPGGGATSSGDEALIVLPLDRADIAWAAALVHRRDRDGDGRLSLQESGLPAELFARLDVDQDGRLTAGEFAGWRDVAPDFRWRAELKAWPGGGLSLAVHEGPASESARLLAEVGATHLTVRADPGRLSDDLATSRRRVLDLFAEADAGRGTGLGSADLTRRDRYELQQLLEVADGNGDGRLSSSEVTRWLDCQELFAAAHVLLTVGDHGRGLFEFLDADHDGRLSSRDLESAAARVRVSRVGPGGLTNLPRQFLATVSRGHPREPLRRPARVGPEWYRAMDRNGDGEVSRKEFVGPASEFDKLDVNRDGRISPEEAARAGK